MRLMESLLSKTMITQLSQFDSIFVGFSGGIDSTALLHTLSQQAVLHHKIHAIYIHHGLSQNADAWEEHCRSICNQLQVNFLSYKVKISQSSNIEEQAREARYQVFQTLLTAKDVLMLGHHAADQAETVLLQLMRGAGVDGLGAMEMVQPFGNAVLMRPLLTCTKDAILHYAEQNQLQWIEDESNQNERFMRNFIRNQIMPALVARWPKAIQNLARTAQHCQQAQKNLDDLATIDCKALLLYKDTLSLNAILHLSPERLTNVIRAWLKQCSTRYPSTKVLNEIVKNVISASSDANPEVQFGHYVIRRFRNQLYFSDSKKDAVVLQDSHWKTFPAPFACDAFQQKLFVKLSSSGFALPSNAHIEVRFRKGGESIRLRGQTKSLKKLFQEWAIPPWLRNKIPLLYVNHMLYVIVGYAVSDIAYSVDFTSMPKMNLFWGQVGAF